MSVFRFIGDPRGEHPRDITAFGISFPAGEAVEVPDERVAAKLRGNSHFAEDAQQPRVGGPNFEGMDKDALEAFARERFGVDIDRRKTVDRLRAELKAKHYGDHEG